VNKYIVHALIYVFSVLTSYLLLGPSQTITESPTPRIIQPQNQLKISARLCGEYAQLKFCENKQWGKGLGACILDHQDKLHPYCDITIAAYDKSFEICKSSKCASKSKGDIAICLFNKIDTLSADCKKNFLSVTTDQN